MLNSLNKIDNSVLSSVKRLSPLNMKRSNNNYLFAFVANHLIYYPTPISLTYAWSFGFLAGMCLFTQVIQEIFLVMPDALHVNLSFSYLEYIMRDKFQIDGSFCCVLVNVGSFLRNFFNNIRWAYTKFVIFFFSMSPFRRYIFLFVGFSSFCCTFEWVIFKIDEYLAFQAAVKKQLLHDVTSPPQTSEYNFQYEYEVALKQNRASAELRQGAWVELVTVCASMGAFLLIPIYLFKFFS